MHLYDRTANRTVTFGAHQKVRKEGDWLTVETRTFTRKSDAESHRGVKPHDVEIVLDVSELQRLVRLARDEGATIV